MSEKSGKTFRRILPGTDRDVSMFVRFESSDRNSVEIFGHEFHPNVLYSMKKKQRWQLPSMITEESYESEYPIVYTKHQCVYNETPVLDLYCYDSVSNKTMGSPDISNRRLAKGHLNVRSVLNEIENGADYTHRERRSYEKLKNQQKKINPSTTMDEELPPQTEHLCNKELRRDSVYFTENVHLNDLSMVNMVKGQSYHYDRRERIRKGTSIKNISANDYENDDNEEIEEDTADNDDYKKPFVISGDDFVCRNVRSCGKRRTIKKKKICSEKRYFVGMSAPIYEKEETKNQPIKSIVFDLSNDVIPWVVIDLSRDRFNDELREIVSFCKCWKSSINPLTIAVDMDQFEESRDKSFLLLRPTIQKSELTVSVKVLFNVANGGFDIKDVLEKEFDSLVTMVTFVQSRLIAGHRESLIRLSSVPNLLILDRSVDELSNLPKAKPVDNVHSLYFYSDEWRRCELSIDNIEDIIDLKGNTNYYSIDYCSVCECETPDDEMITMSGCQHCVCVNCLSSYIIHHQLSKEDDIVYVCPQDGCVTDLDTPTVLSLVSWRCYRQRLDKLESTLLESTGQECHACRSVLIIDEVLRRQKKVVVEYVCTCGKNICSGCGKLQHRPNSCHDLREHHLKIIQLKEEKIAADKLQRVQVYKSRCFNCRRWIAQLTGVNECGCRNVFCTNCRSFYESHKINCQDSVENLWRFPNKEEIVPFQRPRSLGLKLYNQSIYIGLLRSHGNLDILKSDLCKLVAAVTMRKSRPCGVTQLTTSYCQLLRMLESMYIAAYKTYRRKHPRKFELLKVSTNHLLFFICRIEELADEIHGFKREKRPMYGKDAMECKYTMMEGYIDGAGLYARKIMSLL